MAKKNRKRIYIQPAEKADPEKARAEALEALVLWGMKQKDEFDRRETKKRERDAPVDEAKRRPNTSEIETFPKTKNK